MVETCGTGHQASFSASGRPQVAAFLCGFREVDLPTFGGKRRSFHDSPQPGHQTQCRSAKIIREPALYDTAHVARYPPGRGGESTGVYLPVPHGVSEQVEPGLKPSSGSRSYLAVTRLFGAPCPLHPAGIPSLPDDVAQEAYDL